jgi:hypothetical protein
LNFDSQRPQTEPKVFACMNQRYNNNGLGSMDPTTLKGTNGITFEGHDSGPF